VSVVESVLAILRWSGVALAVVASALYVREFLAPDDPAIPNKNRWVSAAVLVMSITLLVRGAQLGTVPLVSSLEALWFYAWLLLVVFLVLVREAAHRTLGAFLVPLAALLALVAALWMAPPGEVNALFKNRLFALHTVSLFLGYSALSVAFCAGVMYLLLFDEIAHKKVGRMFARLPSLDDLDRLGHHTVVLGFVLLTAGIAVGMVWARSEWGVAWVWEPKGVWTLLSWAVYLGYLVARRAAGWQGQRAAWLATLGFVLTVVTLLSSSAMLGAGRHAF
jgi:ABC-type transport system involved in cytochrome c biogenesis permease subunit